MRAPKGRSVRPTADRVREAIFSILGEKTSGAKVLDLFAGTGALALEALSRGAASAVLVEADPRTFDVMRRNIEDLGAVDAECLPLDYRTALRSLRGRGRRFGLVFLDPPYGEGNAERTARDLAGSGVLEPAATVVVEQAARIAGAPFPNGWIRTADRRYGDTNVVIFDVEKEPG